MGKPSKEPRESPISFRPGRLGGAITQRAAGRLAEGQVAKRDLGRYYLLLARVSLDDRLTRSEAIWLTEAAYRLDVAEALSGDPFIPEHRDPSDELLRVVRSAIRQSELSGREPSELALVVQAKVEAMTPLERAALLDAIGRLPFTYEEELYDAGNWALIGIHLADDEPTKESAKA